MTSINVFKCPRCHCDPVCRLVNPPSLYAVSCESCQGLLALGDSEDKAKICWNHCICNDE